MKIFLFINAMIVTFYSFTHLVDNNEIYDGVQTYLHDNFPVAIVFVLYVFVN